MDEKTLLSELDSLVSTPAFDFDNAQRILTIAEDIATKYPDHERAPETMMKGAMVAMTIGQSQTNRGTDGSEAYRKCIYFCDVLMENYPDYEAIRSAYELKAAVLDFDLEDDDAAIKMYQYLIDTYPEDSMNVEGWQSRIDNIDKTIEEIIQGNAGA